jgi:hypothetical protein
MFMFDCIENQDKLMAVAESDGQVYGLISGILSPHPFFDALYSTELAWYVRKGHRGGSAPIKLLKTWVDWSRYHKADWLVIGDICSVQDNQRLYEKLGFTLTEKTYYMKG